MGKPPSIPPLPSRRPRLEAIRAKTILFLKRKAVDGTVILTGELCLHLGWWARLHDAEDMLELLVSEGMLRPLTKEEAWKYGIQYGYMFASV